MHKLDRDSVPKPVCLAGFDYKNQTWDDFKGLCPKLVRLALQRIQGQQIATDDADDEAYVILGLRCAYCECRIYKGGHIEHFRRKNRIRPDGYPELTFVWENLFLACDSKLHCGHYKDRRDAPAYDPDELVKPDEHDPDDFFYFHSSGEVRVRSGLSEADHHRAEETIRVFHLNCRPLVGARAKAVSKYRKMNDLDIEEISSWDPELREEYIRGEIEATEWEPYSTTIKHFLQNAA